MKNLSAKDEKWGKLKVHNFTDLKQVTKPLPYPIWLQDAIPWPPPRKASCTKQARDTRQTRSKIAVQEVQGFENSQSGKPDKLGNETLGPPVQMDEQKTTYIQIPLFPEQTQQLQEIQRLRELQKDQLPTHTSGQNLDLSHSIPDKKAPVLTLSNDQAFPDAKNAPTDAGL